MIGSLGLYIASPSSHRGPYGTLPMLDSHSLKPVGSGTTISAVALRSSPLLPIHLDYNLIQRIVMVGGCLHAASAGDSVDLQVADAR